MGGRVQVGGDMGKQAGKQPIRSECNDWLGFFTVLWLLEMKDLFVFIMRAPDLLMAVGTFNQAYKKKASGNNHTVGL